MTPITLGPDEVVTKDGLYMIDIERYHTDPNLCDGPSVSSSGLRSMIECPAKFWAHSIYNPERRDPPEKETFVIGKAAHAMILEGELPDTFVVSPYDAYRTNEAKEWRKAHQADGHTILKADQLDQIRDMHAALAADPMIQQGLFEGLVECSLVWRDKETGIWLKNRPDVIPNDDTLADAKFVADASPLALIRDLTKFKYHMQFALGVEGMAVVLGRQIQNCAIVACEKAYPHVVTIGAIDPETLQWGARLNRLAIREFADRMKANDWPGYEIGPVTVHLTAWEKKRLEGMKESLPEAPSLSALAASSPA